MQIIFSMNKLRCVAFCFLLTLASGAALADTDYLPLFINGSLYLQASTNPGVKILVPEITDENDKFAVNDVNEIKGNSYLAVFQRYDSNPAQPSGFCGSGHELWLHIYKLHEGVVNYFNGVLVGSCKKGFSLASLESGNPGAEDDYSSFKWDKDGFSIEWFSKKNAQSHEILKTHYIITEAGFASNDEIKP